MRNFAKYSLLLINLFFSLLLVSAKLIPLKNPYEYHFLGLLGLITPLLVIINVVFILIWLISRKYWYALSPALAIWFTWEIFSVCVAGHRGMKQDFTKTGNRFSVMSYNVRLLDFYRWNEDKEARDKIIQFFRNKNPDILCLQEFYTKNDVNGVNNIDDIKKACDYPYVAECNMQVTKRGKWGSIVFSHYPIVFADNYDIDVQGANLLQHVNIAIEKDTVSLFNIHLKSNRLSKPEAGLVSNKELPPLSDTFIEQSKSIFGKLQRSSVNRGFEADIISGIIAQHHHPSIVCGDFNDIPCSYVYFKLKGERKDAFLDRGWGLGPTFRDAAPVLRIDYMLFDHGLALNGFETIDLPYSDHNPLFGNFNLHPIKAGQGQGKLN